MQTIFKYALYAAKLQYVGVAWVWAGAPWSIVIQYIVDPVCKYSMDYFVDIILVLFDVIDTQ